MPEDPSYYQRVDSLVGHADVGGLGRDHRGGFNPARLRRWSLAALLALVALTAVAFVADYLVLRARMAANRANAFGTVTVQQVFYMKQKNGKTEIILGDAVNQSCVRSLFPHLDQSPCWYASRHTEKRTEM